MAEESLTREPAPTVRSRVYGWLVAAVLFVAFFGMGTLGSSQAARGERVLSQLDPILVPARAAGRAFLLDLFAGRRAVAGVVSLLALVLATAAVVRGRRRALPFVLFVSGVALATWGEVLLLGGKDRAGWLLYAGGMVAAFAFGLAFPLKHAFGGVEEPPSPRGLSRLEALGLLALGLVGLAFRGWALMELPKDFDDEMCGVMIGSATGTGIRDYLATELLGTGNGVFHVLTHFLLYKVFGISLFTVRVSSLLWGLSAIPLCYALVRRLFGIGPAFVAALLFATAPEQLFFSRTENAFFSLVSPLALVTAHLSLSMIRRFSAGPVMLAALFMPVCRFVYTPAFVMFTVPLFLAAHAVVFMKGIFRKIWYVAPILVIGLVLWIFSLSAVVSLATRPSRWQFVHPATVRGEAAWRAGISASAGPLDVARAQVARIAGNLGHVVKGMTSNATFRTHWVQRGVVSEKVVTSTPAPAAVLLALGVAFLLAQVHDRRAALLLVWIGVGLLPACMSDEPEARRFSLVFPAIPIVASAFVVSGLRAARELSDRWVSRAAASAVGTGLALVAAAGVASHLLVDLGFTPHDVQVRFSAPVIERSDLILHNLFYRPGRVVSLGNLDLLMDEKAGRCYQYLLKTDWPTKALFPTCDFREYVYQTTLSEEERKQRLQRYRPRRVAYLLYMTEEAKPRIELMRKLYPNVKERTEQIPERNMLHSFEIDAASFASATTPEQAGGRKPFLAGARLVAPGDGEIVVKGSLVSAEGWFKLRLEPACPAARLAIAGTEVSRETLVPMLAGSYPFELRVPAGAACAAPTALVVEPSLSRPESEDRPEPPRLVSPLVATLAEAAPPPLSIGRGYSRAEAPVRLPARPLDAATDRNGLVVLLQKGEAWEIRRYAGDGSSVRVAEPGLPRGTDNLSLSVRPDGQLAVMIQGVVELYAPDGKRAGGFTVPGQPAPSDCAFLADGRLVMARPAQSRLEIYSREGRLEGTIREIPELSPEARLEEPLGLALSEAGTLAIVERRGRVIVVKGVRDGAADLVSSFDVGYPSEPTPEDERRTAFDGEDRLVFPLRSWQVPLVFTLKGERVMAPEPEHDLRYFNLDASTYVSRPDGLVAVCEASPGALVRVIRR